MNALPVDVKVVDSILQYVDVNATVSHLSTKSTLRLACLNHRGVSLTVVKHLLSKGARFHTVKISNEDHCLPYVYFRGSRPMEDIVYLVKNGCTKADLDNQYSFLKLVCEMLPSECF